MQKIQFLCLAVLLIFAACGGGDIPIQKDLFPEIPKFPEFKNKVLASKMISGIKLRLDTSFKRKTNTYYFNYLVKDSSMYIMTYFSDEEFPDIPMSGDQYLVDLVIVTNHQPVKHFRWKINDFAINFKVDKEDNVVIGKRKYLFKDHYLKFEEAADSEIRRSDDPKNFSTWEPRRQESLAKTDYIAPYDQVIIGSEGDISGGVNSGFAYSNSAVYMIYYKLKYKDREGLTKINYKQQEAPFFFKLAEEIYFVTYQNDTDLDTDDMGKNDEFKAYTIYKIEA